MGRASIIPINHIGNIKMKISKPQDIERSAIRKLTLHIVPLMILLYFWRFSIAITWPTPPKRWKITRA